MGFSHWLKKEFRHASHFAKGVVNEAEKLGSGVESVAKEAIDKAGDAVMVGEKEVGSIIKSGEKIVDKQLSTVDSIFSSIGSIPLLLVGGFVLYILMNPQEAGKTSRSLARSASKSSENAPPIIPV